MVSPIDHSLTAARLAALVRQALDAKTATSSHASIRRRSAATTARPTSKDRRDVLASKVVAIDPDHPSRRRQVLRVVIEALLVEEFGEALLNDAAFQEVIDQVVDAVEGDKRMRSDVDKVVASA